MGSPPHDAAGCPYAGITVESSLDVIGTRSGSREIRNGCCLKSWMIALPVLPTQTAEFAAMATYDILIMGASYGSLLASKLLFGGHSIKLVCLPAEADLINLEGFRVRMPVKGRK